MPDPIIEQPKPPAAPTPDTTPAPTPESGLTPPLGEPPQPPPELLTDAERAATQAKFDNLKAQLISVRERTLGDPTADDAREMRRIEEELAKVGASIGASPEPLPSYLGPPQEWDAEHGANVSENFKHDEAAMAENLAGITQPASTETIMPTPAATAAPSPEASPSASAPEAQANQSVQPAAALEPTQTQEVQARSAAPAPRQSLWGRIKGAFAI